MAWKRSRWHSWGCGGLPFDDFSVLKDQRLVLSDGQCLHTRSAGGLSTVTVIVTVIATVLFLYIAFVIILVITVLLLSHVVQCDVVLVNTVSDSHRDRRETRVTRSPVTPQGLWHREL